MTFRLLTALATVVLMAIGTGAVIAAGDAGSNGQSAAKSEYKPGYGPCRDDGTNPSGVHTGPPGRPGANCETKASARSAPAPAACRTGSSFTIRVKGGRAKRITVNGRAVRGARVVMPPQFRGPVLIEVRGVTKRGRTVRRKRVFDPCSTRRNPTVRLG